MPEFLEATVEKFTFKVATDRLYTREGLWAKLDGGQVRIGLTDFLQQRSGDVAFAEVKPVGTKLKAGDDIAVIETIKVDTWLGSPVGGVVVQVNPAMDESPEVINLDPYVDGWMAVVEVEDWEADKGNLFDPEAYFKIMVRQAEEEAAKL